jgi:hypothetical protein
MIKNILNYTYRLPVYLLFVLLLAGPHCNQPYTVPPQAVKNTNYLVVEGDISVGRDTTTIRLTRSVPVTDTTKKLLPVPNATVIVETDAGRSFVMQGTGDGTYLLSYIPLGAVSEKYRLNIKTTDGREYLSDFVEFKKTPLIDSVSWEQHDDGVHIYVNTHDDSAKSKYYRWSFSETWEYHTNFRSKFEYVNGLVVPRKQQIYTCWQTNTPVAIILQSTSALASDIVSRKELMFIPTSSHRIGVLYSMLVKQSVLTKEGLDYWTLLSKNTDNLGSIFDALPSELTGNIRCVTNPNETVIGFISAATTEQQRLWIKHVQVHDWAYPPGAFNGCDTTVITSPFQLDLVISGAYDFWEDLAVIAPVECSDCRLEGGVTEKPPFWP